jgi:hypothetical protein
MFGRYERRSNSLSIDVGGQKTNKKTSSSVPSTPPASSVTSPMNPEQKEYLRDTGRPLRKEETVDYLSAENRYRRCLKQHEAKEHDARVQPKTKDEAKESESSASSIPSVPPPVASPTYPEQEAYLQDTGVPLAKKDAVAYLSSGSRARRLFQQIAEEKGHGDRVQAKTEESASEIARSFP